MNPNKTKKLARITLGFTLFLAIFSIFTSPIFATEWSPDTRLTWSNSLDWAPTIAQTHDGRIWVFWHSFRIGTNPDIFYKVYNGSSTFPWSSTERLTNDLNSDKMPSITTTADENLWVVWSSNRTGNFEIYYTTYDGSSWSAFYQLTNNTNKDEGPSVMQDKDGDIWVVWSSNRTEDPGEIFCSIYNGTNWSPTPIRLTSNLTTDDWGPSITETADNSIWLTWVRDDTLYYKVFYKNFTLKVGDTSLTPGIDIDGKPSIMQAQDGAIWIAWSSYRLATGIDIYCKIYNWSWSEEKVTYDDADDFSPAIMQTANGTIWIAWTSSRLGNFDIYYKTDSPPQHSHDIAIASVTHNPDTTEIYKGLNVSIEVVPQNQGLEPETFVVSCYANSSLLGTQDLIGSQNVSLSVGQLMPIKFMWETSNINSSIYTIIAEVSVVPSETDIADNIFINGVVSVRIPGDGDFNEIVDMYDFYIWRDYFGASSWPSSVNPDYDPITSPGYIDMYDFYIWTEHFGET